MSAMYSPGASSDAYIDRYGATSPSKLANFFDNPLVFLSIALVITILVTPSKVVRELGLE